MEARRPLFPSHHAEVESGWRKANEGVLMKADKSHGAKMKQRRRAKGWVGKRGWGYKSVLGFTEFR